VANLFVYGTLMDKSRLYKLTGKHFPASVAVLKDFKKFPSRLGYPYIIPERGFVVDGLLIRDIDEQSLKKLDQYETEGRLYHRKKVQVICDGEEMSCETYVGNRKFLQPQR
jgi:gamma-glutamylcyclotransferase (GGCT)/AIG2-like uncharacterized protein YtfP